MWIYDSYTIKFVYSSDFHLYRAYTHRKSVWEVYRIQNSIINNTFFIRSHISPQTVYTLSVRVSLTLHRKLNSIWGASNQMKFKLKVTIKLSECRDHWGSPAVPFPTLFPSSPIYYALLCQLEWCGRGTWHANHVKCHIQLQTRCTAATSCLIPVLLGSQELPGEWWG